LNAYVLIRRRSSSVNDKAPVPPVGFFLQTDHEALPAAIMLRAWPLTKKRGHPDLI
jgi:hypothetical protein